MVIVLRKLLMNGDRSYTGAAGKISNQYNCFLKMETEGAKTRCAGCLFQYFTTRTEKARSFVEDGLVLAVIGRRALVDRLGVGGGRIQTG